MNRTTHLAAVLLGFAVAGCGPDAGSVVDLRAPAGTGIVNFDAGGSRLSLFDVAGNAIDAHGGEIAFFEGRYYWYGEHYACGFQWIISGSPFCGFRLYSSPDLVHWTDGGPLFDPNDQWQAWCDGRSAGCFRPRVVHSASTNRYVLWVNAYQAAGGYFQFQAPTPAGPWTLRSRATALAVGASLSWGDHDLFVDDDGTGYVAFTYLDSSDIVIEQLTPDLLDGTGRSVRAGLQHVEAPSLFKRNGRYYLTFSDPNCGYCTTGTSYVTASSPLGPWSARRRISKNSCGGQPSHVSSLPASGGGVWYLYQSDLWNDREWNQATADQYWQPLVFDEQGEIQPLTCAVGFDPPILHLPAVTGEEEGFPAEGQRLSCDIGPVERELRFTATVTGRLRGVRLPVYQRGSVNSVLGGSPNAPLEVEIRMLGGRTRTLAHTSLDPRLVAWSPRMLDVPLDAAIESGTTYAVHLASATMRGCYGMPYRDGVGTVALRSFISRDYGASWRPEAARLTRALLDIAPR